MQPSCVVRIVSLSVALLLPGTIAAADDGALPPVTPFIDSAPVPVPPSQRGSGADARQLSPITPFLDSAPIPPMPATQPSRWYGGKILAADLGTLACLAFLQNEACFVPYLFAGAAIHAFHERPGRAWLSVALRASMPGLGGVVGGLIGGCTFQDEPRDSWDFPPCLGEMLVGMVVGLAAGIALDAAQAFTPPRAAVVDPPVRGAVRLAPRLSLGQAQLTLGLSATF